jgi:hypothetical protein
VEQEEQVQWEEPFMVAQEVQAHQIVVEAPVHPQQLVVVQAP